MFGRVMLTPILQAGADADLQTALYIRCGWNVLVPKAVSTCSGSTPGRWGPSRQRRSQSLALIVRSFASCSSSLGFGLSVMALVP